MSSGRATPILFVLLATTALVSCGPPAPEDLTKADASRRIEELQERTGRGA